MKQKPGCEGPSCSIQEDPTICDACMGIKKPKVEPDGMVRCKKCASWNFKGNTCHHCGESC